MTIRGLDIPDETAELARWLEEQLAGDDLGSLVAELRAGHPADERDATSLESHLGNNVNVILTQGLNGIPATLLRGLIAHPGLLLELQERILIDGGPHWSRRTPSVTETDALARVWSNVSAAISAESKPSVNRVTTPAASPAGTRRASWIGTLSLAAATFLIGVILRGQWPIGPQPPAVAQTGWGWNKPDALKSDVSREVYLANLADGASEWFKKRPETPTALAVRIGQFRQGCSMLLLAEHKPLSVSDRKWLRERCSAWAAKLDGHLTDLEAGGNVESIRVAADQTITTLIEKLRERAAAA